MGEPQMAAARITEMDAEYFGPEGTALMQQTAANGVAEACADEPEADLEAGA